MSRRVVWLQRLLLAGLLAGSSIACPGGGTPDLTGAVWQRLERFSGDEDFATYVGRVREARDRHYGGFLFGCAEASRGAEDPGSPDENITNNQEEGVDEGGIVKAAGDFLVVLRRGRLFTLRHRDNGQDVLVSTARADAYAPGSTLGTWYDELLVKGDRVVVVGYSYQVSATEIGLFRLGADGSLRHEATHFLRSNDYYSSRNYASRLVGDTLIFYMPYHLFTGGTGWHGDQATLPAMRTWQAGGELGAWRDVLSKVEVYRPVQGAIDPTLHTVVRCDLAAEPMSCTARAIAGPYARSFYVSPQAVYVWVAPEWWEQGQPMVYRMPLADGPVGVLAVKGMPIDQFSFKEADGFLSVLALQEQSKGDAMAGPELAFGQLALLRTALDAFTDVPAAAPAQAWTDLPAPTGYTLANRFVGDWLLWGSGNGWWSQEATDRRLLAYPFKTGGAAQAVALTHVVDRIEALGDGALVVGGREKDLVFTSLSLGAQPAVAGTFTRPNATQGETRSHGFFFKPAAAGGGLLGLPVRLDGDAWRHLLYGSAEVQFLSVGTDLSLGQVGALRATEDASVQADDQCQYSCVDWYGNARPIFLGSRILALLGYELVEGARDGQGLMTETRRVSFAPGGN